MLDLKASTSVEPLMKQIGAGLLEQKYATSTRLKATFHQTELVLTIATRLQACRMKSPPAIVSGLDGSFRRMACGAA
jgi:hypothetical protein